MTRTSKDALATLLTALSGLVFLSAYSSWNVWLVGSSNRWAAGVILLLGMRACSLGSPDKDSKGKTTVFLSALGVIALAAALFTLITASSSGLWILIVAFVALWALSTLRHALHLTAHPTVTT